MNPLVSVIVPNYNYSRFVREAIESVLGQTYANVEVIVVDDGSTDDSKAVLDEYGDRIEVVYQQNQGVAAARNNGVARSRGEFVAFLDADDVWLPRKLELQVARMTADETVGLVHVGVEDIDVDGNHLADKVAGLEGRVADEFLLFERSVVLGGGSGAMIRRTLFDEVGGFDTRLSTSADWDLYYRCAVRSSIAFVPGILLKYRIHGSNMHGNIGRMEREMLLGFSKAFEGTPGVGRRRCYGTLYRVLAGSYFRVGDYGHFVRSAFKSIFSAPANITYFLMFPVRRRLKK